ncbi:hypothetical protein [Leifsonia kafniensis]
MRSSDLASPFYGVRAQAGAESLIDRCEAWAARMPSAPVFSHVTAAQLHGIPLPRRMSESAALHVTVVKPVRTPRAVGIVGHTSDSLPDVVLIDGLAVFGPAQTWCQLAPMLGLDEMVAAGDRVIGLPTPLATADQLASAVRAYAGHRHAKKLRAAFELVRPRVESPRETRLRLLLIRAGFPEPETNRPIPLLPGRKPARGDLMYPQYKVLVEYDGQQHRTDEAQYQRDVERLADIAEAGWINVRVLKGMSDATVLANVERALRSRGWRGERS